MLPDGKLHVHFSTKIKHEIKFIARNDSVKKIRRNEFDVLSSRFSWYDVYKHAYPSLHVVHADWQPSDVRHISIEHSYKQIWVWLHWLVKYSPNKWRQWRPRRIEKQSFRSQRMHLLNPRTMCRLKHPKRSIHRLRSPKKVWKCETRQYRLLTVMIG